MTAKRQTTNQQRTTLDRQFAALTLRQAGYTYEQIADRLGYASRASAWHAVRSGVRATGHEPPDELRQGEVQDEVRQGEVQRLEAEQQALWPRATRGDLHAIDRVLTVMVRRATLVGRDAPHRPRVTVEVLLGAMAKRAATGAVLDMAAVLAEAERMLVALLGEPPSHADNFVGCSRASYGQHCVVGSRHGNAAGEEGHNARGVPGSRPTGGA